MMKMISPNKTLTLPSTSILSTITNKEPINEPNINEPQGGSLDSSCSEIYTSDTSSESYKMLSE